MVAFRQRVFCRLGIFQSKSTEQKDFQNATHVHNCRESRSSFCRCIQSTLKTIHNSTTSFSSLSASHETCTLSHTTSMCTCLQHCTMHLRTVYSCKLIVNLAHCCVCQCILNNIVISCFTVEKIQRPKYRQLLAMDISRSTFS